MPLSPLHKGTIVSAPSPLLSRALRVTCLHTVLGNYQQCSLTFFFAFVQASHSQSHLLQCGCMVSMADAATANIPTPISSSPPSTLVTQWWEGVHTSDAVCHILRTGQSLPLTTRSSRWTCIWHHICPPDLLIPASYQDGRVHGRRTHQYSCYTLTGRSSLLCSGWLRLRMPGQRQRKLVNVVDTFQAQRGDKSRAMP